MNSHIDNEFNNINYRPVSSGDLKHSINGRRFFYAQFQGTEFTHGSIQRFTQKIADEYTTNGEMKHIQISVNYDTEKSKSTKLSDINASLDFTGFHQSSDRITGFVIYLA